LTKKVITLVSSFLSAGGTEPVISLLANKLVNDVDQLNLVLLTYSPCFYELHTRIKEYQPNITIEGFSCLMPTNLYGSHDNFDLQTSHVLPAMTRKFHDAKIKEGKTGNE
jgi:hypothetical protein